ncbi:MAG TPA: oxidoreductase [Prolixibacteraceae bacterium]|nr:oxidoreductase [Prolixibacteraceae bacterium]
MKRKLNWKMSAIILLLAGCGTQPKTTATEGNVFTGTPGEVKLVTLDPGHFHAALVQKLPLAQIDTKVKVYAPEGKEVQSHLALVTGYNTREENPTSWTPEVYLGDDFFDRMLTEKAGNVVVLAGSNAKKTEYILKSVEAGFNVLSDKPMVISPENFPILELAFEKAGENKVLLYDIMTERYEITTMLQKELAHMPEVFGELLPGTVDEPSVTKESVHHFSKLVSGKPLVRPVWYFDVLQQGEGIVDVTTHLVDLIQWETFPEVTLSKEDVEMISARRWTTDLTPAMFSKVTGMDSFPDFLQKDVHDNVLKVYSNGEFNYKLRGIHAKVSVIWNFEAPEGTGDTHFSIMRGSKCNVIIRQGAEQNFKPTLYVEAVKDTDLNKLEESLKSSVSGTLASKYPGVGLSKVSEGIWTIVIPDEYNVGHEAHFTQVTEKYLQFLVDGKLPEWEVPNMIVKYYTTTEALKVARK